jgi:cyclophilin family peptidyl-prolyl cis-trans isomerase
MFSVYQFTNSLLTGWSVLYSQLLNLVLCFTYQHHSGGILSMVKTGSDSNSSQFFITTVPCEHLDDVNVVFGEVKKGLGVVEEVSRVPTHQDRPLAVQ